MRMNQKIALDNIIGLPVSYILNIVARILGKILNRNHSSAVDEVKTIVFAKYLGMGSIIQATPLIRSVKNHYKDVKIIFLTSRSCEALVRRLEHIDQVIVVDDSNLFKLLQTTISATKTHMLAKVDLLFDLELYSFYAQIMSLFSLARNRIGFFRKTAKHRLGSYTHLMYYNTSHPVNQVYLQLGRLVGCEAIDENMLGNIKID